MRSFLYRKIIASATVCLFAFNSAVFAISPDEYFNRTHIAHESTYFVSDGAQYTENVIYDDKLGFQHTYKFEYSDTEFSNLVFSSGESVYSRNSMDTLAENVDEIYGSVVGAVNADFFNMSTGVPESAFIKDGIVYTSDRSSNCFARKSDGSYFFGVPDIRFSMLRGATEYNIVFFNKELANNGIYIYTDKFSTETKIKVPTTEIVVYPYSEMLTPREIALEYFDDGEIPDDLYQTVEIIVPVTTDIDTDIIADTYESDDAQDAISNADIALYEELEETSDEVQEQLDEIAEDEQINEITEETAETEEIKAEVEETAEVQYITEYTEVFNEIYRPILDIYALDNGYTNYGGNYFVITDAEPRIGQNQNAVVAETRFNKEGKSLEIPKGAYVLSSDNAGYGYTLNNFSVGETVVIKVTANENFSDVTDAIGCGTVIVKDGEIVEDNSLSHYSSQQPRTAVGIKEDGSVVLFAVDGRKPGTSAGLKLADLSAEMIRAGCIEAANFDGGGSTTVKVMDLSVNKLVTSNTPSDSSERKIANAVVITNKGEKTGKAVYSYIESEKAFVMPNSVMPIPDSINYTDENHHGVNVQNITKDDYTYTAENGTLTEEGYSPSGFVGIDSIISTHTDGHTNVASKIISVDNVDNIKLTSDNNTIYPHETIQLDVESTLYGWKVYDSLSEYNWGVSDDNGYIDENAVYYPAFSSDNTELFAYFGNAVGKLSVSVLPYPFEDINGHWSVDYCCTLYDEGVSNGEITLDGRMYFPERTYTRNEFCTMLSRIMGLTVATDTTETSSETDEAVSKAIIDGETYAADESENADNTIAVASYDEIPETDLTKSNNETVYVKTMFEDDSQIPLWAYDSVCALYELGLLSDFAHNTETGMIFDGVQPVTRREVMSVIGRLFENPPDNYEMSFTDYDNTSSDSQYVKNSAYAGIIEGYEDSSLRPDGLLTRAEGAAIFTRLLESSAKLN